jgi:hypothetical protein
MINLVTDEGQTLKLPFEEFRKNQNKSWKEENDDDYNIDEEV